MKLSLKPIRASRAPGFQGHYGGSQLVLTLYRMHFFCFQMCSNRLPEMMKNGDAGIFPVYYSLKSRSGLYSVLSNIRTGPADADAFRGHKLTTQKGYTYQKEIKGPRKVNTHAIIGK